VWNRALGLLPQDSKQAEWVRDKVGSLVTTLNSVPDPHVKPDHAWARKLGPLGPIAIVLAKSKGLLLAIFKLKFLFYRNLCGPVRLALWRRLCGEHSHP